MVLTNGLGAPKLVTKFKSLFEFHKNYILVEKDKLMAFKEEELKKLKEYNKAQAKVEIQQQKVNRGYEMMVHFKK